jgi:hypothetical protein
MPMPSTAAGGGRRALSRPWLQVVQLVCTMPLSPEAFFSLAGGAASVKDSLAGTVTGVDPVCARTALLDQVAVISRAPTSHP